MWILVWLVTVSQEPNQCTHLRSIDINPSGFLKYFSIHLTFSKHSQNEKRKCYPSAGEMVCVEVGFRQTSYYYTNWPLLDFVWACLCLHGYQFTKSCQAATIKKKEFSNKNQKELGKD